MSTLVEDVSEQIARRDSAAATLELALDVLASEAKAAKRRLAGKRPAVDLSPVVGAFRTVERAEQAFDIAVLDLATARGEDA